MTLATLKALVLRALLTFVHAFLGALIAGPALGITSLSVLKLAAVTAFAPAISIIYNALGAFTVAPLPTTVHEA